MADPNYVHIITILDRSGSMESIKNDTIGGINAFVADQAKQTGKCTMTLVQFDTVYETLYSFVNAKDVEPRNTGNYIPRGGTALLDAIGRTIISEGQALAAMPESQRPGLVLLTIVTDGEENSSREMSYSKVKEMIEHQQEKYSWKNSYIGTGGLKDAQLLGIESSNSVLGGQGGSGIRGAFAAYASNSTRRRAAVQVHGSVGAAEEALGDVGFAYSAEERATALGGVQNLNTGKSINPFDLDEEESETP